MSVIIINQMSYVRKEFLFHSIVFIDKIGINTNTIKINIKALTLVSKSQNIKYHTQQSNNKIS
ncbi:hypothetical protein DERP_004950 [Dermatophagoides pteronyssinus]|uniref:Uncharacterized protein n=1 Tax=Dermatophagoides pteronyssinus TaxID=6956 RepID=A0ABQ8JT43_DERPT|nr:hypothetical protein DERP_004950 [Dermatophagoides pteronyssinus]